MKRVFDFSIALWAVYLLSPVFCIIAILVRQKIGCPIIFKQVRPGLYGKPFTMYKFRTMTEENGPDGNLLSDAQRMTKFGAFLRASSLDELPELFNVMKGEMSLVGPRPLLVQYLERYNDEQVRRHEVKPGITGWAQINGRNKISWSKKFKMDIWYVENRNFWLDVKILLLTVRQVFRREGIHQEGHETAKEFMGNENND